MGPMKNITRRRIYFLGAMWNLSFAISGLAFPGLTMWLISGSTELIPGILGRTFFAFFWIAVGLFGIGYYLVSRNPDMNDAVIWTGCLGKLIIFLTFGYHYLCNQVTLIAFLVGLGDVIWTILFLAARSREKTTTL
jgi:hypothetical protein